MLQVLELTGWFHDSAPAKQLKQTTLMTGRSATDCKGHHTVHAVPAVLGLAIEDTRSIVLHVDRQSDTKLWTPVERQQASVDVASRPIFGPRSDLVVLTLSIARQPTLLVVAHIAQLFTCISTFIVGANHGRAFYSCGRCGRPTAVK